MDQRFCVYAILVLVGIMGASGDIAVNFWARSHRWEWWAISCIVWIATATLFGLILRWNYFEFGVAVILALLIHSICAVLFDWVWYKTTLTTTQWIGILIAFIAIGFIEGGKNAEDTSPARPTVNQ